MEKEVTRLKRGKNIKIEEKRKWRELLVLLGVIGEFKIQKGSFI